MMSNANLFIVAWGNSCSHSGLYGQIAPDCFSMEEKTLFALSEMLLATSKCLTEPSLFSILDDCAIEIISRVALKSSDFYFLEILCVRYAFKCGGARARPGLV